MNLTTEKKMKRGGNALVSVLTKPTTTRQISLNPFIPNAYGKQHQVWPWQTKVCTKTTDSVNVLSLSHAQTIQQRF